MPAQRKPEPAVSSDPWMTLTEGRSTRRSRLAFWSCASPTGACVLYRLGARMLRVRRSDLEGLLRRVPTVREAG